MGWAILIVTMVAALRQPMPVPDAELAQHLANVRAQLADPAINLIRREGLAQDMAGTLDRAAQTATDPEERRQRRGEAIDLIDQFTRANPELTLDRQLRFQAAVFRWAQAQTWMQTAEFEPANPKHRESAIGLLDDAIARLALSRRSAIGRPWAITCGSAWRRRSQTGPSSSRPARMTGVAARMRRWTCWSSPRRPRVWRATGTC